MRKDAKLYGAFILTIIIVAVVVGVSVYYGTRPSDSKGSAMAKPTTAQPTPNPVAAERYTKAAVAADAEICSQVGRDILKKGGSAVDGVIATLICVGTVNFQSTGIGGGGFMVVYNRASKRAETFDYRETGPANLTAEIYNGDATSAKVGGKAVGVPGEIRGLRAAFNKYGNLTWKELFQPSIDLCTKGFPITKHLALNMKKNQKYIFADRGLKELLVYPGTNKLREVGTTLKRPKLAATLKVLSETPESMYTGDIAKQFVKDVQSNNNGLLSLDDMKNYSVIQRTPLEVKLGKDTLFTLPAPNGGPVLTHILNMNEGYNYDKSDTSSLSKTILTYHRIVETLKFSYAYRPYLGDPDFQQNKTKFDQIYQKVISKLQATTDRQKIDDSKTHKNYSFYGDYFSRTEDHGTTHVSVLAENGDAASATDTINYAFGAKFRSMTSGILFNNELADFFRNDSFTGYPWPKANAPGAGKRPLSSTCPSIIVDENGDVRMVVGGSGGTRITLSVAWVKEWTSIRTMLKCLEVIMKKLWFDMELGAAVTDARTQHALFPPYIRNEKDYPLSPSVVSGLKKKGHDIRSSSFYAVVQAIYKAKDGTVFAKSDPRKHGKSAGY
eukprot:gene13927-15378_t